MADRHFVQVDANGMVFVQWTLHDATGNEVIPTAAVDVTTHVQRTGPKALLYHTREPNGQFTIAAPLAAYTDSLRK